MQMSTLGESNLEVSAIGLGCMGMSQSHSPRPDDPAKLAQALVRMLGSSCL